MSLRLYTSSDRAAWNDFIQQSVNGCFLHEREFMEYHSDRFQDHSLMAFDDDNLRGCFPAHVVDDHLISHNGLTYAGWIVSADATDLDNLHQALLDYSQNNSIINLKIKLPPAIYDDIYQKTFDALNSNGYSVNDTADDVVIDLADWQPSAKKTIGYRNGKFDQLQVQQSEDLAYYWNNILVPSLKNRHNATPVHSLAEIQLLQSRFPDGIKLHIVEFDQEPIAGILVFDFGNILKIQYAASTSLGFEKNAMDYLYLELIAQARQDGKKHIDLGIVNERDGSINQGLLRFKKQLGGKQLKVATATYTFTA
ncbi:GNAT family N-acetyltransferase [Nonlabens ponticola]|uniref:GNAT family N-acetyltransferase n=1 Tax=Nonlabens ponticola TaxID=2496866 RepID=UPI0019D2CDEE|nr:GNAT family N-acetyltransferase [Nonlabens ponticola]